MIDGDFFVLLPCVLDYVEGDGTLRHEESFRGLAQDGELIAYQHHNFWEPRGTLREKQLLNSLWESGKALWCTRG